MSDLNSVTLGKLSPNKMVGCLCCISSRMLFTCINAKGYHLFWMIRSIFVLPGSIDTYRQSFIHLFTHTMDKCGCSSCVSETKLLALNAFRLVYLAHLLFTLLLAVSIVVIAKQSLEMLVSILCFTATLLCISNCSKKE